MNPNAFGGAEFLEYREWEEEVKHGRITYQPKQRNNRDLTISMYQAEPFMVPPGIHEYPEDCRPQKYRWIGQEDGDPACVQKSGGMSSSAVSGDMGQCRAWINLDQGWRYCLIFHPDFPKDFFSVIPLEKKF